MPSQQQFIELGVLVRDARDWFDIYHVNNGYAMGGAIELAEAMLLPWAEQTVVERLDQDPSEAQDFLSEAAARIVAGFASVTALTGKEFYTLMKTTVERLVCDQERRRFARRCRGGGETFSLDRDAATARLAELLVDEQPTGEMVAMLRELQVEVRRARQRLTREERLAVRLVMEGMTLARIVEAFGVPMRAAWRRARLRLREKLAGG